MAMFLGLMQSYLFLSLGSWDWRSHVLGVWFFLNKVAVFLVSGLVLKGRSLKTCPESLKRST